MRLVRFAAVALLALSLWAPFAAQAQTVAAAPTAPAPTAPAPTATAPTADAAPATTGVAPKPAKPKPATTQAQRFQKRFDAANTSHDGHLTLEQAKAAKWTAVVRRFSKIDVDQKGYVTAPELRADYLTQRAAKAKQNASPTSQPAPTSSRS